MASVAELKVRHDPEPGSIQWIDQHVKRGITEPHAEIVDLTPALASFLLARNPDNRRINVTRQRQHVAAIQNGRWMLNGSALVMSKDGLLNDGQTRCMAVIEANTAIPTFIVFGVERDSRKTVDLTAVRTAANFLEFDNMSHSRERAAIARWLLAYEASGGRSVLGAHSFGALELYDRAADDEALGFVANYIAENTKHMRPRVPPSVVGFCYYVFRQYDPDLAATYINQIVLGEDITRDDVAYMVRARLETERSKFDKVEVIFRGWSYLKQGRDPAHIRLSKGKTLPAVN